MKLRLIENQLIVESSAESVSDKSYDELKSFIGKNCMPFLKEAKYHILYRGVNTSSGKVSADHTDPIAFIKPVRQDRIPLNSNKFMTNFFNTMIKDTGLVANRNNAIFCSGDKAVAVTYGKVYAVIPIGQFNYTWSPAADDWFLNYHTLRRVFEFKERYQNSRNSVEEVYRMIRHYISDTERGSIEDVLALPKQKQDEWVDTVLNKLIDRVIEEEPLELEGDDGTLTKAIISGHEIMIKCDEVLYIDPSLAPKLFEEIGFETTVN